VFTGTPGFLDYRSTGGRAGALDPVPLTAGRALPDGRTLLASGTDGVIRAIDLETGDTSRRFPAPGIAPVSSVMDLSRDGRTVAEVAWEGPESGGGRSVLEVFDAATGKRRLAGARLPPLDAGAVAVSPSGRYVAVSGSSEGRVLIYDTTAPLPEVEQVGSPVSGVIQLPIVTTSARPGPLPTIAGLRRTAGLAFRPDGMLVTGSLAGVVTIVDPKDGSVVTRLSGAPALTSNQNVALSADGSALVTTGTRGIVRWNLTTGRPDRVSRLREDSCWSVAMLAAPQTLLCGGRFGQVVELALENLQPTGTRFDMQAGQVSALVVTSDGRTLTELSDTRPVLARWRLDGTGPVTRRLDVNAAPYQYNADGRRLLVTGRGVRTTAVGDAWPEHSVVDARTGTLVDRLDRYVDAAWTTQPNQLAVWDKSGDPSVIDMGTGRRVLTLHGGVDVPTTAFAATGGKFLVGCGANDIQSCEVWDLRTGDPVFAQAVDTGSAASISADGRFLTWSGEDALVTFDTRTRARRTRTDVTHGAVSPAGVVAGSTLDGRLSFFDARTLRTVGPPLAGAPGPVEQFEFTRDGTVLATRGSDGAVRLIDVSRRVELGEPIQLTRVPDRAPGSALDGLFQVTADPARNIALRGDGTELALPDAHGILVWDLRSEHWREAACAFAGRNLTNAEWRTYFDGLGDYHRSCPATA
jgi:WD40 repeat protein